MNSGDPLEEYCEWLFDFIRYDDYCDRYGRLLYLLSGREFRWSVDHDENRAGDGFALRLRFAWETGYDEDFWRGRMPGQCSLLEMMIALSVRPNAIPYWINGLTGGIAETEKAGCFIFAARVLTRERRKSGTRCTPG